MSSKTKDLRDILVPHSDCGNEREYAEMMADKLRAYTDAENVKVDRLNNVIGFIGDPDKYTIMLEAHIDEISLIVQSITEDGFIRVKNVGGTDRRTLPSSEVIINGLTGLVCSIPPHLSNDTRRVPAYENLYIDMGLPAEEVKKKINIGDRVYVTSTFTELQNNCVSGRAHDDRICAYGILSALKKLSPMIKNGSLDCCIAVLLGTQEEIGCRGAHVGAFTIHPDEAIVIDVCLSSEEGHRNDRSLGNGILIEGAAYFNRQMVRDLVSVAKEKKIKYQRDVSAQSGGTDAADVALACSGVDTVLLSLPLRHMHQPCEVISLNDVDSLADLLSEYIKKKFRKSAKAKGGNE